MFGRPDIRTASVNHQEQHVQTNATMPENIGTTGWNHQRQHIQENHESPKNVADIKRKSRPRRSGVKVRARKRRADQRLEAEHHERYAQLVRQGAMEKAKKEAELRDRDSTKTLGFLLGAGDNHESKQRVEKDVQNSGKSATLEGELATATIGQDNAGGELNLDIEDSSSGRCVCALICTCNVSDVRRCLCAEMCYCD